MFFDIIQRSENEVSFDLTFVNQRPLNRLRGLNDQRGERREPGGRAHQPAAGPAVQVSDADAGGQSWHARAAGARLYGRTGGVLDLLLQSRGWGWTGQPGRTGGDQLQPDRAGEVRQESGLSLHADRE